MSKPVSGGGAEDMRGTNLVRHLQRQVANQQGGADLDGSSTQKKARADSPKRLAASDVTELDEDESVPNDLGIDRHTSDRLDY
jgi:hypothetical protein